MPEDNQRSRKLSEKEKRARRAARARAHARQARAEAEREALETTDRQGRNEASHLTHEEQQERRKQVIPGRDVIEDHAPTNLDEGPFSLDAVVKAVEGREAIEMIVLAADIRQSTLLMKEAVEFDLFAAAIGGYVSATKEFLRSHLGWWDKFTGDGFLAYWLFKVEEGSQGPSEEIINALHVIMRMLRSFDDAVVPDLRANSRNFPSGVGLSIGVDAGPAYMVNIAEDLTVVGPPVVGAVRMVDVAKPWEVVGNVYLGEYMERHLPCCFDRVASVRREYRKTKEYAAQEVYPIVLEDFSRPRTIPTTASPDPHQ